jgi:hypothetical protein
MGIMNISRTKQNVKNLTRLSDRAKQRIITPGPFFFVIDFGGSFGSTLTGQDDRSIKIQRQTIKGQLMQSGNNQVPI